MRHPVHVYLEGERLSGIKRGWRIAREEERERKTTMSSNWIKISSTKGGRHSMHSFLTTFRFGLEADFHVGLRNNRRWGAGARSQVCHARVTHPSLLHTYRESVVTRKKLMASKREHIARQRRRGRPLIFRWIGQSV